MTISRNENVRKKLILSLLIFLSGGLIGPFTRWIAWPPSSGSPLEKLVYDLVFLLWPAQMLAVAEATTGETAALLLAIGGNILLFAIVGILIVVIVGKLQTTLTAYVLLATGIILLALWGAGFDYKFLNALALLIALGIYALLVYFVRVVWISRQ